MRWFHCHSDNYLLVTKCLSCSLKQQLRRQWLYTVCVCCPPPRVGHNEIIGVMRVGCNADGLGRDHWNEMLAYPRKPIAHWHPLLESKKSEKEVGSGRFLYALVHSGPEATKMRLVFISGTLTLQIFPLCLNRPESDSAGKRKKKSAYVWWITSFVSACPAVEGEDSQLRQPRLLPLTQAPC